MQHEPSRLEAIAALLAAGNRQLADAAALGYSFSASIAAAAQQTASAVAEATRLEKEVAAAAAAALDAERAQAAALQVLQVRRAMGVFHSRCGRALAPTLLATRPFPSRPLVRRPESRPSRCVERW